MATARFSFTLGCPMNSDSFCGRSFNSKEESSSTWAADTRRSFRLGSALVDATGRIVAEITLGLIINQNDLGTGPVAGRVLGKSTVGGAGESFAAHDEIEEQG